MALRQLYYTSCEHGLAGYGGYQFNASSPGIPSAVLREVEERTIYEPPRWLVADRYPDEPEAYPVAFSYGMSEATNLAILAHVVFAGNDYSGRPGNYFVHALVTSAPDLDFSPFLPAELWGAALWQRDPVASSELPELPGPLSRGVIDRPGVQAFLDTRGADAVLPELLTAVGRAMAGEPPVLLVSQDVTENAWWIAAVSYCLGDRLAYRMTFTTYSHRPGYSPYHLTGILPDALPPDAGRLFRKFDFAAGRTPGLDVHPLAALLASTGVLAPPGLWQQAEAFASGTEKDLDDWLGPVAVAAGLLGRPLSALQIDAVARWLPTAAGHMQAQLADVGLGVVLAQPEGTLTDESLLDLLGLARRLAIPARVEQAERLLAGQAVARIRRGEPATPVAFQSAASQIARDRVVEILTASSLATVAVTLEWAAASGVELPDADLERYGRNCLDPADAHKIARVLTFYPAAIRGLLGRLAAEPAGVARAVLGGPLAAQLTRGDLAGHPELTEVWLLQSVLRGEARPLQAFDEIVDIRADAERSPRVDATMLHLLWPDGCPADQLMELLGFFADPAVPASPEVLRWFAAQIKTVSTRDSTTDGWPRLARMLAGHRMVTMLPEPESCSVRNTVRVLPLLEQARLGGIEVLLGLFQEYTTADAATRHLLDRTLPSLLIETTPLERALRECPPDIAAAVCRQIEDRLASSRADIRLARRVYVTLAHPEVIAQPQLNDRLNASFEPVRRWQRRDLNALAQALDGDAELARSFRRWRDARRGGFVRKLFGGTSPAPRH